MKTDTRARRRWATHLSLWIVIALVAPLGWRAYRGAALEAEVAMLLSFCAGLVR